MFRHKQDLRHHLIFMCPQSRYIVPNQTKVFIKENDRITDMLLAILCELVAAVSPENRNMLRSLCTYYTVVLIVKIHQ